MTSLAAQLKKLAVPDTQSLLSSGLRQASFLYPEGEAATYDKQHFYNIGINGLQQLIQKDTIFEEFEQNLFAPSSQSFQRLTQSSDVNKQLDASIETFLLRLSPYMALREAHKAMEWMVHRYNVHLRNTDIFMMCVLPYHDQEVFIRALRLLKLNSNECAKWRWLEPIKKGETFLPRQTLVAHCKAQKGFLGFICDLMAKYIEANTDGSSGSFPHRIQRMISFCTQTILGVLMSAPGPPSEHILATLIPAIASGLGSHGLQDHTMSSFMVLSQLLVQANLEVKLLESFLNVLCKNLKPNMLSSGLSVVVLMYQRQTIDRLPKKAFKYLSRHSDLALTLASLSKETDIEPFLTPLVAHLTPRALKDGGMGGAMTSDSNQDDDDFVAPQPRLTLLMDLMTNIALTCKTVVVIVRCLLDWYSTQTESETGNEMEVDEEESSMEGAHRVFKVLENRFSSSLESAMKEMSKKDKAMKTTVKRLYKTSARWAQESLRSDPASAVTLCLYHHNVDVRVSAAERLVKDIHLVDEKEELQSALVLRLQDDSPAVVCALLENPENLWELFEDKTILEDIFFKKLLSIGNQHVQQKGMKWRVNRLILKALGSVPLSQSNDSKYLTVFLTYMVPMVLQDIVVAKEILQSSFALRNKLLEHLSDEILPQLNKINVDVNEGESNDMDTVYKIDAVTQKALTKQLINSIATYFASNSVRTKQLVEGILSQLHYSPRPGCLVYVVLMGLLKAVHLVSESLESQAKLLLQSVLVRFLEDVTLNKNLIAFREDYGKSKASGTTLENPLTEPSVALAVGCDPCIARLRRDGRLPLSLVSHLLEGLQLQSVPKALIGSQFWQISQDGNVEDLWLDTLTIITTLMLHLSSLKKSAGQPVAKSQLPMIYKSVGDHSTMVKFLSWLWTGSAGLTNVARARCLQFSQVVISSMDVQARLKLVAESSPALPCLLLLLCSPHEKVREAALQIMCALVRDVTTDGTFKWTVDSLARYKEEITKDNNFLPQVMKNILEGSEASLLAPPSPKKRRRNSSRPPPSLGALTFLHDVLLEPSTPATVRVGVLRVLSCLESVESFLPLPPLLSGLLSHPDTSMSTEPHEMAILILQRFTPAVASCLDVNTDGFKSLKVALAFPNVGGLGQPESIQMVALKQLSSSFMSSVPATSRHTLVSQLLDICVKAKPEVAGRCQKVIKKMVLESSIVVSELKSVVSAGAPGTVRESKKRRASEVVSAEPPLDRLEWRRLTILLELVQDKKKVAEPVKMLQPLFQVLAKVLELEKEGGSGEYLKQLVLGTVCQVCTRSMSKAKEGSDTGVTGDHLNMELVVQCIRTSDSHHTHQQALMLLSAVAHIAPTLLLHNMMSVFTFMGDNILRQDDSYSFHVIERILDNVIPALVTACDQSKDKLPKQGRQSADKPPSSEDLMTMVLRVFVEAMPHVPAHRRMMLCKKLVSVSGAESYLWRLILLFLERVTVRRARGDTSDDLDETMDTDDDKSAAGPMTTSDLDLLTSLCQEFGPSELLCCFTKTLTYISGLPEEKQGKTVAPANKDTLDLTRLSPEDMQVFSVAQHSAKQLRHFKFAAVFALKELLTQHSTVAQMGSQDPEGFLPDFQLLMETCLKLISQVTMSHDKSAGGPSHRFWKVLQHKCHDLLDGMVHLLPDRQFLSVVSSLMSHDLALVQRRALDLLNTKLLYFKENTQELQPDVLLDMTDRLEERVKLTLLTEQEVGEEDLVIGQAALYGLKVMCRILGAGGQDKFVKLLPLCTNVLSSHSDAGVLSASAMLCIAEVVANHRVHTLGQLGDFLPLIVDQLRSPEILRHEMLLLAAVSSLQKIMEALPQFLSPYLLDIIVELCKISAELTSGSDVHKPAVLQKVKHICTTVATATPTRTFLPVLEKSITVLEDDMASCAGCAMSMLRDHVVKMSREELTTFSQDLLAFFLVCFDIRVKYTQISEDDLDTIETCVIDAFVSLVFKLSEAQFKPMLIQIYGWATSEDTSPDRALFFYHLCYCLADKLKNLFTLFAGHILKHSAETLELNNKSKQKVQYFGPGKAARRKSGCLLKYIMDCLHKTFAHDTEGFVNKERFDIVMAPLVDQLENDLGSSAASSERISSHLVPCLASLAGAAQDDSLWKDLNYHILLKTRNEDIKVKIWALQGVDALHKQLGEDYTQLVPETIPFLAELMEDDSDEVEKQTQKVLAAMETSVGESLQEYF